MQIAVLLNGYDSPYKPHIRESFERAIRAAVANGPILAPNIDFFDPIVEQTYPEAGKYDLIVLSGGTEDPMGSAPWVLKMQEYLRTTVANYPKRKILGICWGHQTINVSFGGTVGDMDEAELGVTDITLTEAGHRLLPFVKERPLKMHEFHKREIKVPAPGFIALAEQSQAFLNDANTILTFQGHPELNSELAAKMLDGMPSYMGVGVVQREALKQNVTLEHDGIEIWRKILTWVKA